MKKKVFVLICESIYDMCEETISCAVFDSLEKAQSVMRVEYEATKKEWGGDDFVHEIYDMSAQHYIDGRFSETHCQWLIQESVIG